jgi:hypothetical protein
MENVMQKHQGKTMLMEVHKDRHIQLHRELDSVVADFIRVNSNKLLGSTSLLEFLEWSGKQAKVSLDHDAIGISVEDHKAFHVASHNSLDELTADWILHCGERTPEEKSLLLTRTSIMDLATWSFQQTQDPTDLIN